ncbi:MAG: threonine synthase [Ginsengibacter sp.]
MLYYSLNGQSPKVNFKEAAILGQAPDGGLYFPESIPVLEKEFFENIEKYSKEEIAFKVIAPFVGDTIPEEELRKIVAETVNFDIPVKQIKENVFSLELFHGPTLAFKDVGARFMSRCLGYFVQERPEDFNKKITVLVATSGDTGGAVANGFYDVDGIEVVILYPSGKVSSVQELQLTTLGKNITAIEVDGNFDDCQKLVKQAFTDTELNNSLFLTSANSINIARWLSQQFYYFFAWQQWAQKEKPPVICVPSGNFGNICAGLLAAHRGLPVNHFIAACNANDVFPNYLEEGNYSPKKSVATISNAMDVGAPSNFVRILQLFEKEFSSIKKNISSYTISDSETKDTIKEVYFDHHYLLDPHGAVAYASLEKYMQDKSDISGMILETAHPVKFYDVVEPVTGEKIPLPEEIQALLTKEKKTVKIPADFKQLKNYLLS